MVAKCFYYDKDVCTRNGIVALAKMVCTTHQQMHGVNRFNVRANVPATPAQLEVKARSAEASRKRQERTMQAKMANAQGEPLSDQHKRLFESESKRVVARAER